MPSRKIKRPSRALTEILKEKHLYAVECPHCAHRFSIHREFNALFRTIVDQIALGKDVKVHGFGRFGVKKLAAMKFTSPFGEVDVPERFQLAFTAARANIAKINPWLKKEEQQNNPSNDHLNINSSTQNNEETKK